jgi:hypothetical protein
MDIAGNDVLAFDVTARDFPCEILLGVNSACASENNKEQ